MPVHSNIIITSASTGTKAEWKIIYKQLQTIDQKINTDLISSLIAPSIPMSTRPQTVASSDAIPSIQVALYYFNQTEDQKLPPSQQVNVDSILPVYRTISSSKDIIKDTINLLLRGDLTNTERAKGFTTQFPNSDFHLISSQLQNNGTLILTFTEVPGFTDGGSARMLILSNSIIKTAKQFPEVRYVTLAPDILFQP